MHAPACVRMHLCAHRRCVCARLCVHAPPRAKDCSAEYSLLEKKKFAAPKDMTLSRFNEHIRQAVPIPNPAPFLLSLGAVVLLSLSVAFGPRPLPLSLSWPLTSIAVHNRPFRSGFGY